MQSGFTYLCSVKQYNIYCNCFLITQVQPPLIGAEKDSLRSCTAYLLMYKKGELENVQF